MTDAFKTTEQAKHLARSALFQMRQGPLQSVSDYVHAVQLKARGLDMSEKDLVSIVLNGIDPSIRQYIVMDRPTKIQDILKSPATQQDFMVTQQHGGTIMVLQEELRALREQLSSMTLQQAQVAATATHQHHVKFQDEQPCRTCHESRTRHPSSSEQRRRSHSRSRERNGTNSQDSSSKCNFCGKFTCRGQQFCFARDKVCHYCNKKGHLRMVCRKWQDIRHKVKLTMPSFLPNSTIDSYMLRYRIQHSCCINRIFIEVHMAKQGYLLTHENCKLSLKHRQSISIIFLGLTQNIAISWFIVITDIMNDILASHKLIYSHKSSENTQIITRVLSGNFVVFLKNFP